ncbi:unnamed protein product [Rhodiola kirilowii]
MWRTIIFFNPLQTHFPTDFASDKMNKAWTGLEQAPQGTLKNKLYGLGLKLLVRVKPSEIFFKSITKEVSEVEIVYPTSLNARLVLRRLRHIASRGCVIHKKYLYASASLVPLTTAFTVLRLPNIPFFRSQVLISYEEAHDNIIGEPLNGQVNQCRHPTHLVLNGDLRQDCDPQCHQMYTGSEGVCLGFVYGVTNGLCSCSYPCGPPDPPPSCLGGSGINCSLQCGNNCCSQRCAGKFRNGSGHCRSINGMSICECYYPC